MVDRHRSSVLLPPARRPTLLLLFTKRRQSRKSSEDDAVGCTDDDGNGIVGPLWRKTRRDFREERTSRLPGGYHRPFGVVSKCALRDGKTNLEQMDARTEEAGKWIAKKNITKVMMNPPYENKYGCMTIVENMLDSVPSHTMCGFILPDKKLEKASKTQIKQILGNHRLTKIIKMPEDLFLGVGVTTSIFVFETGVPQGDNEIFGCYIETDGLETVKNKGRHDVRHHWPAIERYWVDIVKKLRDDKHGTAQWLKPSEHLSYQMPEKPFEIFKEDFRKTAMDYLMFQQGIDAKEFGDKLLTITVYSSEISSTDDNVRFSIKAGDTDEAD